MNSIKQKTHRNCLNCGKRFRMYKTTDKVCSIKCFRELQSKNQIELSKRIPKKIEYPEPLQKAIERLVKIFHEYTRLRDEGLPCASCGTPWDSLFQAGHLYKAELYSSLRFTENNVNSQCYACNIHKEGNFEEYLKRLPERIGKTKTNLLIALASMDHKTEHKWDREQIKELTENYKSKLKALKLKKNQ